MHFLSENQALLGLLKVFYVQIFIICLGNVYYLFRKCLLRMGLQQRNPVSARERQRCAISSSQGK